MSLVTFNLKNLMHRYIISALLPLMMAATLGAQNRYDALRFSENNYYGTAKSIALGNAVTALGGDLGSIGINPAGSAVASYSQFSITPDITVSSASCDYAPVAGSQTTGTMNASKSRFTLPNIGVSINMNTGNDWGLKNMTFGFVANSTNNYLNSVNASGVNSHSSFMGSLAAGAMDEGYTSSVLNDFESYYGVGSYAPSWNSILGYRSNIIGGFGDDENAYYAGGSENIYLGEDGIYYVDLGGDINQAYKRQEVGHKTDVIMNFAMNFDDKFYLGANIGIPQISYSSVDYISETPVDVDDFQMGLLNGKYHYSYTADADGIYAKIGFIWRPLNGLRIGGALQTPTIYSVSESWWLSGESSYADSSYDASDSTPQADFRYNLRTPAIYNLGVAYTFGSKGFISADWERTDYRGMRFSQYADPYDGSYYESDFSAVNRDIAVNCYSQNVFRLGAEYRIRQDLAVRAGYNSKNTAKSYSIGLGYSSGGSFFLDAAARATQYNRKAYCPYDDYLYNADGTVLASMAAYSARKLVDFVVTFGWRF